MIDLYQFTPAFGHANISPPCMKVEAFLRLSELPFQIINEDNPAKGPKSKLPFIRDNGLVIGDSELIMDYLESKYDFSMDGHLDTINRAHHQAYSRMLDDHLYWALVYSRWMDEKNWPVFKKQIFGAMPPPISHLAAWFVKKGVKKQLHEQGTGRHSRDEIYDMAKKDINQLAVYLDGKQWFGGSYVSKLDISAVAYLSNILLPELDSPMADCIRQHDNLLEYSERNYSIFFPEPIAERQMPGEIPKSMQTSDTSTVNNS
ncbi:MAG: glutathione S-transferase family protein [Pseudomonadales bacterium]|nr:glutathione S-transferase family protein [Pseudomonadales bacterium]